MPVQFAFLADRVDAISLISTWYFDEWGHLIRDDSIERTRDRIEEYVNRDEIPFILLATRDDEIVGAAQLKFREMEECFLKRSTGWVEYMSQPTIEVRVTAR